MIKFNFTFKIIKNKPKKYSLIKKVPLFADKSKVSKGKERKRRRSNLDGKTFHMELTRGMFTYQKSPSF